MPAPSLDRLLAPVTRDDFLDRHWDRRPLLVRAGDPHRFAGLFGVEEMDRLVTEGGLGWPFVRLVRDGGDLPVDGYTRRDAPGTPEERVVTDAAACVRAVEAGATLSLAALETGWEPIADLCAALADDLGPTASKLHVNAYFTPESARGFDPHYDTHDVFVLQLSGTKKWTVHGAPVPWPTKRQTSGRFPDAVKREIAENEPLIETVLEPGDLLYMPRGFIHWAETTDTHSLHLTVGVCVDRWIDRAADALAAAKAACAAEPAFREELPRGFATDPAGEGSALWPERAAAFLRAFREAAASVHGPAGRPQRPLAQRGRLAARMVGAAPVGEVSAPPAPTPALPRWAGEGERPALLEGVPGVADWPALSIDGIDRLLATGRARAPRVTLVDAQGPVPPALWTTGLQLGANAVGGIPDADAVADRLDTGGALLIDDLHGLDPAVRALCVALARERERPVRAAALLARAGDGTAWASPHTLLYRVASGAAEWRLWAPGNGGGADLVLRAEAGPVLSVPPGWRHALRPIGTALVLRVEIAARRWLDLIDAPVAAVLDALEALPEFRRAVPPGGRMGGGMVDRVAALFGRHADVAGVRDQALRDLLAALPDTRAGALAAGVRGASAPARGFRARPDRLVLQGRDGDATVLVFGDRRLSLTGRAAPAVRALLTGRPSAPEDWPGDLSERERRALARSFLKEGLIEPV